MTEQDWSVSRRKLRLALVFGGDIDTPDADAATVRAALIARGVAITDLRSMWRIAGYDGVPAIQEALREFTE